MLRGRRVDCRRNRARPVHVAASASPGNRRGYPVGAVVGAPAPARESPRRAQAASLARYRQGHRAGRVSRSCPPRWTCGDGARDSGWHAARPSPTWSRKFPRSSPAWGHSGARCASIRLPMIWPTGARFASLTWTRTPGSIPWPGPSVTSITQPIDLGPFEDASPCRVLFMRRHGMFGGTTGSGKSGGLNVLMGNLVACRDVVIWAIDLKKGMELGPWESCIGTARHDSRASHCPAPRCGRHPGSARGIARRSGQARMGDIAGHARAGDHHR